MSTKKREGIVYSTNPDFLSEADPVAPEVTLPPEQQMLYVWLDSRARKGKTVTLIRGFKGSITDGEHLATELKKLCGSGGSLKEGEIIIQGNFRDKIMNYLAEKGYRTKKAGG
jgi:translation initiation factor 1